MTAPRGMVQKVVACLVRSIDRERELLVFRHPSGIVQIPKGTLEEGESPHEAVLGSCQGHIAPAVP